MRYIIPIILFALFISCSTEPEDCAGVAGGVSILDDCGICNGDNSSCTDCDGVVNGTSILDNCGICGGDNLSCTGCLNEIACNYNSGATIIEDCIYALDDYDCDGNCLLDFECNGNCISLGAILPDYEEIFSSSGILNMCDEYNNIFSESYNQELISIDQSYIFYEQDTSSCNILLSAPHSQRTWRYNNPYTENCSYYDQHDRDLRTGVIAKILHELTGCATIVKKYQSDDPNYHHLVPECTQTDAFENIVGQLLPYKQKILDYTNQNESIKFVMDFHGWLRENRTGDIDMGTMYNQSLESTTGQCLPEIISKILINRGISSTVDYTYTASVNETVTKFISESIDGIVDAMQLEIERSYRSCDEQNFSNLVYAFLEIIFVSNYLYQLEITIN